MSAAEVVEYVGRVYRVYRGGLITLGEMVDMLAEIDRRWGPQPVTRAALVDAAERVG